MVASVTHRHSIVRKFFEQYQHFAEFEELRASLESVTYSLGFSYFALIHHANPDSKRDLLVHLHNYPPDWATYYVEHQLFRHDPVLEACNHTHVGFAWEDIESLIRMTPRLAFTIESSAKNGLGTGYTVPAHIPGEPPGSCSFVTKQGVSLSTHVEGKACMNERHLLREPRGFKNGNNVGDACRPGTSWVNRYIWPDCRDQ